MPKRVSGRAIKAHRTYTVQEAATTLDVTVATVRSWCRAGLPVMKASRPYLILGADLKAFVDRRRTRNKVNLGPGEVYCLGCKAARRPLAGMVDAIPRTSGSVRMTCLCEVCEKVCNRVVTASEAARWAAELDVAMPDGCAA